MSEDNLNEPEQDVFEVFVVTEVVSIASEKVTEMLSVIETPLWLSVGEIDETVGAVVSEVVVVLTVVEVVFSSFSPQEMMVRLKRNMEKMRSICLTWFPISGLGEPNIYQNLGDFTIMWGRLWMSHLRLIELVQLVLLKKFGSEIRTVTIVRYLRW